MYWYHATPNGLPEELTDRDGQIIWQARYHSWGNLALETQPAPAAPGQDVHDNLRHAGQYHDRETGLFYNTFRYFDPDIGRFTTEDPIGLAGGHNLYQYAPNPFAWIDPWGWNRNANSAEGHYVLYEVYDKDGTVLKVGKAKGEDIMPTTGDNRRAHTSARIAQKRGYEGARARVVEDLGHTTTGKAKDAEAARVRRLRESGHALPLNRENSKKYKPGLCKGK